MEERKLYLNIQEQVEKNRKDIKDMQEGVNILANFGIKVIGQVDDASELPDPAEYDGDFGDAYLVGTENPYDYYIFTRAFEGEDEPSWFNIGEFPLPGPQGPQGETGEAGHTPEVTATAAAVRLEAGVYPQVSVIPITSDNGDVSLGFTFGIPKGDKGDTGAQGSPGAFNIKGQVNSAELLPSASSVDPTAAYAVGSTLPYDIYVIMTVNNEQSWLNLGPVITEISDTILISNSYVAQGQLSEEQMLTIASDTNMNFLKIGNNIFGKFNVEEGESSTTYKYGCVDIGGIKVLSINSLSRVWEIISYEFVNLLGEQTISGVKTFPQQVKQTYSGITFEYLMRGDGKLVIRRTSSSRGIMIGNGIEATNAADDIGSSSAPYRDGYFTRNITDGTNSVTVANISSKVLTTIGTGTFDNGSFSISRSNFPTSVDGAYFVTFGNVQCIVILTDSMLTNSNIYPIRVPCCVPDGVNSYTGQLTIILNNNYVNFYCNRANGDAIADGYQATVIKTSLL